MGHLLMENRNGLVVDTETTRATGTAEREAAEAMVGDVAGTGRITLGSDKAFDVAEHVASLREMNVTPLVAQNNTNRVLGHRRSHHAASRLRHEPAHPQADRRGLRLDHGARAACARPATAGSSASAGRSPSRRPPTT